ncbi:MAG: hypothetical protein LBN41_04610 [Enterobacteriaceae bacterium]|jgi:hypothetical protein|nr:hypothetical protein [Enterobacteriaceae bacterium]
MNTTKFPYKMNRFFVLMGICFFGWLTYFSFNQITGVEQWLVIGQSATLSVEQARYLLCASSVIFALLTLMSVIILLNSFTSRQNVVFTEDSVSFPKGHVLPKVITIMYRDIKSLELVNRHHNEALEITTSQGNYLIQQTLLKNEKVFNDVWLLLKQKNRAIY